MKRFLSAFLMLCMLLEVCPATVFAAEEPSSGVSSSVSSLPGDTEDSGNGTVTISSENTLTLNMYSGWLLKNPFYITLVGQDNTVEGILNPLTRDSVDSGLIESHKMSVVMEDIPNGRYTMKIESKYHLDYSQEVTFNNSNVTINLCNNPAFNSEGKLGVMPMGDINEDGVINDSDADLVLSQDIDVTGDNTVDVQDLAAVIRNAGEPVQAPIVSYTIPVVELGDDTIVDTENVPQGFSMYREDDEVISEESPVVVNLAPPSDTNESISGIVIGAPDVQEYAIKSGLVEVEDEEGNIYTYEIPQEETPAQSSRLKTRVLSRAAAQGEITRDANGTLVINFGSRVVIKKVTIKVTSVESGGNLAQIASVEFYNNFEDRLPEPKLDIPTVKSVTNSESDGQGYKSITITWTPQINVTGYEVSVSGEGYNKTAVTSDTTYTFQGDSFNGTVKSFKTYAVKVRSLNGDWKSNWSTVYNHTVTCNKVPPAPEYVGTVPGVKSLTVSWRCKYDAEYFSLFYKKTSDTSFSEVRDIQNPSYTLTNLEGGVEYTVYVVAHNRNGSSGKSSNAVGMPRTPDGVDFTQYKIITNDKISSISGNNGTSYSIYKEDGTTISNSVATSEDWKALLDGNPNTYLYIPDWDSGVTYANFRGPIIQLKNKETINTIRMSPSETSNVHMNAVTVRYKNDDGTYSTVNTSFANKNDRQGRRYYEVVTEHPITTDYLEIRTTTTYTRNYTICEVRLYNYDDIEDLVNGLFADKSHSRLNSDVTESKIKSLLDRVNTIDSVSHEYHPHRETIVNELNYALQVLKDGTPANIVTVDNQITASGNPASGFAQALSDYQPLGYVAEANSTLVIYVEDKDNRVSRGTNLPLKLVATQYHPEVAAWQSSGIQLKAGRNEVTIPRIGSYAKEPGGSLYLQYTGAKGAGNYEVRVIGGTKIPVLNLDGITGADREARISSYVSELREYVGNLQSLHNSTHKDIGYDYSITECFLNQTEITMENMMYSFPASQVWSAISSNPESRLESAIEAMEQQIDYFYQFKGINKSATDADAYPNLRLNIRYHKPFTGAFMYAGGKHIGIGWGSVGGLFSMNPIVTNEEGRKLSGNLSGWGVAHEIGHCINAAAYQRVEVTNNVYPQMATTDESNATSRAKYDDVYKQVVTGTLGHTGNLSTQLAKYWQLHLAYDDNYIFKVYDSIEEQQANLFYARMESYLRTPSKAPVALTSTSGDQGLMQAACAAANRDILDFFRAWGIYPNKATEVYASNFEKETRKIQYLDDNSRLYRIQGNPGMSAGTTVSASITTPIVNSRINGNKVVFELGNTNTNDNAMLGYEITRNGKTVAFVPASKSTYTDVITTENNKSFVYSIKGIDRLLNETDAIVLDEVKISHDGAISKDKWVATTNMASSSDTSTELTPDDGNMSHDTTVFESGIKYAIDNDTSTVYYGSSTKTRPEIVINLGGVKQVTALKFIPDSGEHSNYRLFGYRVEISMDGNSWTTVKEGNSYTGSASNPDSWVRQEDVIYNADGSYTMYFSQRNEDGTLDPYMYTYDAAYVRLTATNMSSLAIAELDILGPTSDNVDLIEEGYGRLKEDFYVEDELALSAGSTIFYGDYKGDPSYSVVLLRDQEDRIINGEQLILASVAEHGCLGETSDGRWVYSVSDEDLEGVTDVYVELYRVQDAITMVGQRLTSNSLHMKLPDNCPEVILGGNEEIVTLLSNAINALADATSITITNGEAQTLGDAYGNEGSIYIDSDDEIGEIIGRVRLTPSEDSMKFEIMRQDSAIAMMVEFSGVPEDAVVSDFGSDESSYRAYKYDEDNGSLKLYGVNRKGTYNGGLFHGVIGNLDKGTTVVATATDLFSISSNAIVDEDVRCEATIPTPSPEPSPSESPSPSPTSHPIETPSPSPSGSPSPSPSETPSPSPSETPTPSPAPTPDPSPSPLPDPDFDDVQKGSWYEKAVEYVYQMGIMVGTSSTKFSPGVPETRGMIVTTLYRLSGSTEVDDKAPFKDVKQDAYYAKAIDWAYKNNIVAGYSKDKFGPDDLITREQIATILYRYAIFRGEDVSRLAVLDSYSDVNKISSYAVTPIRWANRRGMMVGISKTILDPKGKATRAQVATMLYRYLNL